MDAQLLGADAAWSDAAAYAAGLAAGELRFQRCRWCAAAVAPARMLCPACGSADFRWERSRGDGMVRRSSTARRVGHGVEVEAVVELAEGFRMAVPVVGPRPEGLPVGTAVRLDFRTREGQPQPVFRCVPR